jgi:hypothetical protein
MTPRTDAKAKWILTEFGPRNNGRFHMMSDHARSLELELEAMTIERDKLLKACQDEKAKSIVDKILAERKLAAMTAAKDRALNGLILEHDHHYDHHQSVCGGVDGGCNDCKLIKELFDMEQLNESDHGGNLQSGKLAAAHDVLKSCKNLIDQNRGLTLCQGSEWVSLLKDIDQAIK